MTDLFDVIYVCETCGGERTIYAGGRHGMHMKRARNKLNKALAVGINARIVPTARQRYYGGVVDVMSCSCQVLFA